MFGNKKKRDERREQKLFEELTTLFEAEKDQEIIDRVGELEYEDRPARIWFFLIRSYNRTEQYRKAFRELERMKEVCNTTEERVTWYYLDSYAMFCSGRQMLAEFNLKKGLSLDPENAELRGLCEKISEKEEQAKKRVVGLLNELEQTISVLKQEAEESGTLGGCDEETFALLLSYPSVLRQVPGMKACIGMEPLYRCSGQKEADEVRQYLWSSYQALEAEELFEKARKEWSTEHEFQLYDSYWEKEEGTALGVLSENGEANFDYFQRFAKLFRETVGSCGFRANELSELMNLLRVQYACGMISEEELHERMQKLASRAKESFSSWEEYARSLVCGATYLAFKRSGGNFDEALTRMEAMIKVLTYCDWFAYGWYSEEAEKVVRSGKERLAWRENKNPDSITIFEALKEYIDDNPEEGLGALSKMIVLPMADADLDAFEDEFECKVTVGRNEYAAKIRKCPVGRRPTFFQHHLFREAEMQAILRATRGLEVSMEMVGDAGEGYQAQLKVIAGLLPNAVAVLDESADKILSGRWVSMAAQAKTVPAPNYFFTIQAVSGEGEELWIHTKGLSRFGVPELEIIRSDRAHYVEHSRVLNILSRHLLEGKVLREKEPFPLAGLASGQPLLVALCKRIEAEGIYGTLSEEIRVNREVMMPKGGYAVLCYPTEEDFNEKRCLPLTALDELLSQKPKFWKSEKEAKRIRSLAQERLEFMKTALEGGAVKVLTQAAVTREEVTEYLFLELKKKTEQGFAGIVTGEPEKLTTVHKGDTLEITGEQVEDWCILLGNNRITPDDCYMLGQRA